MRSHIGGADGGYDGDGVIWLLVFLVVASISLLLLLFHLYVLCCIRSATVVALSSRLLQRDGEKEGATVDLPEGQCAVCLSSLAADGGAAVRVLHRCRHVFHAGCIGRWLSSHSVRCPLCRTLARAEAPPSSPEAGESFAGDSLTFM
ncbi:unnamed protein product [Spirodela intermedia]|uniref:RING-type domain-containing protein n=1 Tax=Spirodela intermedia TaxID=51605 RepID=A0A7I8IV16_SPIIN|nr:unnamed protein product [Spirodela intermedia]CAA6661836.1 unnamed protein product [Spirodela intermedia]